MTTFCFEIKEDKLDAALAVAQRAGRTPKTQQQWMEFMIRLVEERGECELIGIFQQPNLN